MKEKNTAVAAGATAPKRRESGGAGAGKRTGEENGEGYLAEHAAPGSKSGGVQPRKRTRLGKGHGDALEQAAPAPKRRESGGAGAGKRTGEENSEGDLAEHAAPGSKSGGVQPRKRTRLGKGDGDALEQAAPAPKRRASARKGERDDEGGEDAPDDTRRVGDDMLRAIISLLPPKDGARTQGVAHRWRPLWRKCSLNIDANLLSDDEFERFSLVREILSNSKHPGPVHRFSFHGIRLHTGKKKFAEEAAELESWFRSPAFVGIQEMNISFSLLTRKKKPKSFRPQLGPYRKKLYQLPSSLFAVAPTLETAKLSICKFPVKIASSMAFPMLKVLHLSRTTISEKVFHGILSGCRVLASMDLHGLNAMGCFRISSPTLRSVALRCCFSVNGQVIIQDAPCLERLFISSLQESGEESVETIRVVNAPMLEILGPLSSFQSELVIADTVFKGLTPYPSTNTISTVKVLGLAIQSSLPDLNIVLDVLRCFPCLEKLYFTRTMKENVDQRDLTCEVTGLETGINELIMTQYQGDEQDVCFLKFFILNASVLKKIKLVVEKIDDSWVSDQQILLEVGAKASPDAQLEFVACCFEKLGHR